MDARQTTHSESPHNVDHPVYRVNYWERPAPGFGWNLDAWVLVSAGDVLEAIRWTQDNARGRRFELFAEVEPEPPGNHPRHTPLVRLVGINPNLPPVA